MTDDKGPCSTSEIALMRMFDGRHEATPDDIQRMISSSMRDVVGRDAKSNPNNLRPAEPVRAEKPKQLEEMPLPGPTRKEIELIDRLAEKFCGPPNGPVK